MQKEIKLGLVVGFALLLAILLVWYKSGEEEPGKAPPGVDTIESIIGTTPAPKPETPTPPPTEAIPLPPQVTAAPEKPVTIETKPAPAVETIKIPQTHPVVGTIGPPPKPPTPPAVAEKPPAKPATEVAKAPEPKPAVKEEPPKEAPEAEAQKPPEPALKSTFTPPTTEQTYIVQPGDNLVRIARKFYQDDKKWTLILEANKNVIHNPDTLYVGLKLKIPPLPAKKEEAAAPTPKKETPAPKEVAGKKYTVQAGDTLTSIAEDEYGDGKLWKKILDANPSLKDPRDLKEGQVIIIPPK